MIERYTRPVLTALWSDARRYETWLKVELAACEAMENAGTVPAGTAAEVRADVHRVYSLLGPHLIVSPSHEAILPNVPMENVAAMAEAVAEIRKESL